MEIMPLILDTCVFLWLLEDSEKLTIDIKKIIQENAPCYLSSISLAEIEIKRSIGKLNIPGDYRKYIDLSGLKELSYSFADSEILNKLVFYHKDPFDRMLITQALARNMTVMTGDKIFAKYPAKTIIIK
jgi:PIN domain nuclease of toxin-antitoxin system